MDPCGTPKGPVREFSDISGMRCSISSPSTHRIKKQVDEPGEKQFTGFQDDS